MAASVLKVGERLATPRLIAATPMLLLGLLPTVKIPLKMLRKQIDFNLRFDKNDFIGNLPTSQKKEISREYRLSVDCLGEQVALIYWIGGFRKQFVPFFGVTDSTLMIIKSCKISTK